jgi:hypothetical protein
MRGRTTEIENVSKQSSLSGPNHRCLGPLSQMVQVYRAQQQARDLLLGNAVLGVLLVVAVSGAFLWWAM